MMRKLLIVLTFLAAALAVGPSPLWAADKEKPVKVAYRFTAPAPREPGDADVELK